jgi:hypothetical protein
MRDHTLGTVIIGRSVTSNAPGIAVASEQVAPLAGQVPETHTVSVGVAISVSYTAYTLNACCSKTVVTITGVVAWSVIEVTTVVLVVVVALTCTIVVEEGVGDAVVALFVRRAEARRTPREHGPT